MKNNKSTIPAPKQQAASAQASGSTRPSAAGERLTQATNLPTMPSLFNKSAGGVTETPSLISEINMTPLIDVMLVLLIVFMITLPAIYQTIQIELPQINAEPVDNSSSTDIIDLSINAKGQVYWNQTAVDEHTLEQKIKAAAQQPSSYIYLRADRTVAYERVAYIIALAQRHHLNKLGFITELEKEAPPH